MYFICSAKVPPASLAATYLGTEVKKVYIKVTSPKNKHVMGKFLVQFSL
jgi:hypothetical protein